MQTYVRDAQADFGQFRAANKLTFTDYGPVRGGWTEAKRSVTLSDRKAIAEVTAFFECAQRIGSRIESQRQNPTILNPTYGPFQTRRPVSPQPYQAREGRLGHHRRRPSDRSAEHVRHKDR